MRVRSWPLEGNGVVATHLHMEVPRTYMDEMGVACHSHATHMDRKRLGEERMHSRKIDKSSGIK